MQSIFGEFYTGADGKDYFYLPFLKTVYHIPTDDLVTFNALDIVLLLHLLWELFFIVSFQEMCCYAYL